MSVPSDATSIVRDDGEHEWVRTVAADELPDLMRLLDAEPGSDVLDELAARWTGRASYELERRIRESGLGTLAVF